MSKNITIQEGGSARNFSGVNKLTTNLIGGGTQNWIPEDEAANYVTTAELEVTENGTYTAADDGYVGYSQVEVRVRDGETTLIEKTIDTNGTYNASDDDADGYSKVEVNVPGIQLSGREIQALAIENINAGETVYVSVGTGDDPPPTIPIPTGMNTAWGVFLYNGYVYFGDNINSLYRVPYNNLSATPEQITYEEGGRVQYNSGFDGYSGGLVVKGYNYMYSVASKARASKLSTTTYGKSSNHMFHHGHFVYDDNLNVLIDSYSSKGNCFTASGKGVSYNPNNTHPFIIWDASGTEYYDVNTPLVDSDELFYALDNRLYCISGTGTHLESAGKFGYIDIDSIGANDTFVTFHPLFDVYSGSNAHNNIHFSATSDCQQLIINDVTYGTYIINSDGSVYKHYTGIDKGYVAWLVGDLLFTNNKCYNLGGDATMAKTTSKNHSNLGICKANVQQNQRGTAIILFS